MNFIEKTSKGPTLVSESGPLAWQPVTDDLLVELARRSQSRISENEDFAEVRERLAKVEERNGVVHLAELMEEQSEENEQEKKDSKDEAEESETAAAPSSNKEDAEDEDQPTPQQLEALLILADLVILTT